jgi:sugar-specific transcriptional regulator TrmB
VKLDDLARRLAAFGLEPAEASAYLHLSRLGPARAAEVARATGIRRSEVYRVMAALEAKGYVEKTLTRPQRFVASPLPAVLERAFDARAEALAGLEAEVQALPRDWPTPREGPGEEAERFTVHQGRTQLKGLLQRLVAAASEEVCVVAMRRGLGRLESLGFLEALRAKAAGGALVRVLLEVDRSNLEVARALGPGCKVRHLELPGQHQLAIADNREIALFVAVDPLVSSGKERETVLRLTSPDFILAQRTLFDAMWTQGAELGERARELETGVLPGAAVVVRGRFMRHERMRQMLHRATREIRLAVPPAEAPRLARAGIAAVLARRAAEGVRVRFLAPAGRLAVEGAQQRPAEADRVRLVIDGAEALRVLGGGGGGVERTDEGEWSLWTTLAPEVAEETQAFEAAWVTASGPGGPRGPRP